MPSGSLTERGGLGRTQLSIRSTLTGLALSGDCDFLSGDRLTAALRRGERRARPFAVDLANVTFADSLGLEPFAESVRRCRRLHRPEPRLVEPSLAVRRVLDLLGVDHDPFDLEAWDDKARLLPRARPQDVDGGGRYRPRGTRSTTSAGSYPPVTTLITTTRSDPDSATVRVAGALDEEAAVVLCELLLAHGKRGRRRLDIDVGSVSEVKAVALSLLAAAVSVSTARVTMTPLPSQVCASLTDATLQGDTAG